MFNGCDFLAELTQHLPLKGIQYIRRYGLYASRTNKKWTEQEQSDVGAVFRKIQFQSLRFTSCKRYRVFQEGLHG